MKSDKILDKIKEITVEDIIRDKMKREDREKNWIDNNLSKRRKLNWIRNVYLLKSLISLRKLTKAIEYEIQKFSG